MSVVSTWCFYDWDLIQIEKRIRNFQEIFISVPKQIYMSKTRTSFERIQGQTTTQTYARSYAKVSARTHRCKHLEPCVRMLRHMLVCPAHAHTHVRTRTRTHNSRNWNDKFYNAKQMRQCSHKINRSHNDKNACDIENNFIQWHANEGEYALQYGRDLSNSMDAAKAQTKSM